MTKVSAEPRADVEIAPRRLSKRGRNWTIAEDSILRESATRGAAHIAELLGRPISAIHCRASRLGVRLGHMNPEAWATSSKEAFLERIEFDTNGGCWLWSGTYSTNGYGVAVQHNLRPTLAHRAAIELWHGPIPDGLFALHKCDVPACCNPSHLYVGDDIANAEDRRTRGRARNGYMSGTLVKRTACTRGHDYVEGSYRLCSQGIRHCKICERARQRGRRG